MHLHDMGQDYDFDGDGIPDGVDLAADEHISGIDVLADGMLRAAELVADAGADDLDGLPTEPDLGTDGGSLGGLDGLDHDLLPDLDGSAPFDAVAGDPVAGDLDGAGGFAPAEPTEPDESMAVADAGGGLDAIAGFAPTPPDLADAGSDGSAGGPFPI